MVFILVENGVVVARLVPELEPRCTAGELADALHGHTLLPAEVAAFREDIRCRPRTRGREVWRVTGLVR